MRYYLFILFAFILNDAFAQERIEDTQALHYKVKTEDGVIDYMKVGLDTTSVKPVMIFLQGSLPVPLVIGFDNFNHVNLPFDPTYLIERYHLVVISMPGTPVFAKKKQLNNSFCYLTDPENPQSFSEEFLKANVLETYVNRTQSVIEDLCDRSWVWGTDINLMGHSQGAKIATVVASQNKLIGTVSLFGFNPYGRYEEKLRRNREAFKSGKIKPEDYLYNLENLYDEWRAINDSPDDFKKGYNSALSFSINYMPYLLKIEAPIYLAWGTNDFIAANADLVPLEFIKAGKTNFAYIPYPGLDHNFFKLKDGKPDYENGAHWNDVVADLLIWLVHG
ncbi:MAG: hypothetical protein AAF502_09365 [Bacteroidota bacterium]